MLMLFTRKQVGQAAASKLHAELLLAVLLDTGTSCQQFEHR